MSESEVNSIAQSSIGIMPLPDNEWARGKCSLKMLQYMSCGLPVVVSHVGMNIEILNLGNIGFGTKSLSDWSSALSTLINDRELRIKLGNQGRKTTVESFDTELMSSKLLEVINKTYS